MKNILCIDVGDFFHAAKTLPEGSRLMWPTGGSVRPTIALSSAAFYLAQRHMLFEEVTLTVDGIYTVIWSLGSKLQNITGKEIDALIDAAAIPDPVTEDPPVDGGGGKQPPLVDEPPDEPPADPPPTDGGKGGDDGGKGGPK